MNTQQRQTIERAALTVVACPLTRPRPRALRIYHTADALHFKATGGPLPIAQIRYMQASGNYTIMHTTDPKRPYIIIAYTMRQMCEWAPRLTRVRKGLAVNFAHVASISAGDILMSHGQRFAVSRRYWQVVEAAWQDEMGL